MNTPTQVAVCVILDDYGRVLLLHRDLGEQSHWELPGGKVKRDETPDMAVLRELREELGIGLRIVKNLGKELVEQADGSYEFHWFQGDIVGGQPEIKEPELFDDLDSFDLEDLLSLALSTNLLVLYPKIMSGEVALD